MIGQYSPARPRARGILAGTSGSLVSVDDGDVAILTLRRSLFPRQDYYILRLQEMVGRARRTVRLMFAPELRLQWAAHADVVERKGKTIPRDENLLSAGNWAVRDVDPGSWVSIGDVRQNGSFSR